MKLQQFNSRMHFI